MKRYLFLVPLALTLLVAGVGWWARRTIQADMERDLGEKLTAMLGANLAALDVWMADRRRSAELAASNPDFRRAVLSLRERSKEAEGSATVLRAAPEQRTIATHMRETGEQQGFEGFLLMDTDGRVLAFPRRGFVGKVIGSPFREELAAEGEQGTHLYVPKSHLRPRRLARDPRENGSRDRPPRPRSPAPRPREQGEAPPADGPRPPDDGGDRSPPDWEAELTVMISTPIRNDDGEVVATLARRLPTGDEFTRILSVARFGESGESYAFNADGVMITRSRFEADLRSSGLLKDEADATTAMNLRIRDPEASVEGADFTVTGRDGEKWVPTRPVAAGLQGVSGLDTSGFRDYRGVPVIGAWRWLDDRSMGIVTKVDRSEAFATLVTLQRRSGVLLVLLALMTVALAVYSVLASLLHSRAREAEKEVHELGQYRLEERIGEGGMGVVYRASHTLLRRPTAIKLLVSGNARREAAVKQFEQEVRLTSQLAHPNTIQIYDYGRTETGVFYYAMEYLDGISLDGLVGSYGPPPPGRIIFILSQVCDSLAEAHAAHLVHRDIKPSNIMLTARGGRADWVKVLDFGLVTRLTNGDGEELPAVLLAGTPQYMAPEAFADPTAIDVRTDIYALGGVAYYLLTGLSPFHGQEYDGIRKACLKRTREDWDRWLEHLRPDHSLDSLILACLALDPGDRPASIGEVADRLRACPEAGSWTEREAHDWWQQREGRLNGNVSSGRSEDATIQSEGTVQVELTRRTD